MNWRLGRAWFLWSGLALFVPALACLGLSFSCYAFVNDFVAGARHVGGTIVAVSRPGVDEAGGEEGYRMVVAFADESGREQHRELTGLYRTDAGSVGRGISLLVNPDHPWMVAPDSPSNWVGSRFYGIAALGLFLAGSSAVTIASLLAFLIPSHRKDDLKTC